MERSNTSAKTAFLAIVGRPNVGKSTLLNLLVGQKIAIVTDKPQTTRTRIMGVLTQDDTQYVFIDTPGLHKPRTRLGEHMVRAVHSGLSEVDACILVAEANVNPGPGEIELIEKIKERKLPCILVLNKIDLLPEKKPLLELIARYQSLHSFDTVIPMSCDGDYDEQGLELLRGEIRKYATEHPHYFDADTLTDQPERVIAAEILREKLLVLLEDEVPHGIAISVERFAERSTEDREILDIEMLIYCEKDTHKGIIIGKKGAMLKKAATLARADLEAFFQCSVNLQCWVKVKGDWRNKQGLIRNFGLD